MIKTGAVGEEDRELYEYAVKSTVLMISPLILSLVIATVMKVPVNGVAFIVPYMTLRKFSGGYHAERLSSCLIMSVMLITIMLYISKSEYVVNVLFPAVSVASVILCIFSPIEVSGKSINNKEKKVYKRIVQLQVLFYLIVVLMFYSLHMYHISASIMCGVILSALLQLPCVIKDKIKV